MRRSTRPIRKGLPLLAALLLGALSLGACRGRPVEGMGTSLGSGDTLHGRLVEGRRSQAFTFEGVESSVLDFDLQADESNQASPQVALLDPEGREVDLAPHVKTAPGAATTRVRDVILMRTGTYQVTVTPASPCEPVYYRFSHELRFPGMEDFRVTLSACDEQPIYVSAPRGGQVVVRVAPMKGSSVKPLIKAVKDPWGGRTLDPTRKPDWAPPAIVSTGMDGTIFLNFTAPIPGMYTIVAASRPGSEGPALISTTVRLPPGPPRRVAHPNRPPEDFGLPAAGSASDPAPR